MGPAGECTSLPHHSRSGTHWPLQVVQPPSLQGRGQRRAPSLEAGGHCRKSRGEAEGASVALPQLPSQTHPSFPSMERSQRAAGLNHRGVTTWKRSRHHTCKWLLIVSPARVPCQPVSRPLESFLWLPPTLPSADLSPPPHLHTTAHRICLGHCLSVWFLLQRRSLAFGNAVATGGQHTGSEAPRVAAEICQ